MAHCLVGLGSNLGDRTANLLAALAALGQTRGIRVLRVSSLHRTPPVGGPAGQRDYLNAAAVLETDHSPEQTLAALRVVEQALGRERPERWAARNIDLDLLLYERESRAGAELSIPHPAMHERGFVLAPAAEIAPDWLHPPTNKTIDQLLHGLPADADRPAMRVFTDPRQIQSEILRLKLLGKRVGLVPTMGALHAGHLSLVEIAREHAEVVAATIFVNPTQFGPSEDLARYPRTLDADLDALASVRCDLVFVPQPADIYPPGFSTYVEPPAVAAPLEGVCRPGHFRGVATVVLKLFHLLPGDVACFGQKDYQQLQVIRRMVSDLAIPMEIVPCPTVREPDGLAMSSRNRYLSPSQRDQALAVSRALAAAANLFAAGERSSAALVARMRSILQAAGIERIDYVTVADSETLAEKETADQQSVALIAAFVGTTRLIDNRLLSTA